MSIDLPEGTGARRPTRLQHVVVCAVLLTVALSYLAKYWRDGQPVALPDVPAGKLACMSYTPRQGPQTMPGGVTPEQIEADLALLAAETKCVRTYSSTRGMDALPPIARKLDLRVLLGIWIGTDPKANEEDIATAIAIAKRDHDVIDGIVVGNEVLLRREQPVEVLRGYIDRVRRETDVPVTYADVWEFWRRGAELADTVDFLTIHILPYWEDEPVAVEAALQHLRDIHARMQTEFPGKRLLIGETGWPTQGRQREGAAPGIVNAARYVREFVAYANASGLPYNIIEAYDQPWKRANEGTVGGYWGIYDAAGRPKFPLQGPVVEDRHWRVGWVAAVAGALMFVAGGIATRAAIGTRAGILLAVAGLGAGAVAYAQWRYHLPANRDIFEWMWSLAALLCGWLLYVRVVMAVARHGEGGATATAFVPGAEVLREVFARRRQPMAALGGTRLDSVLRLALLFGIAYVCLGLALDGRFRDFPVATVVLPVTALCMQHWLTRPTADSPGIEEVMLAAIVLATAILIMALEGPLNGSAWLWCLLSSALALSVLHAGLRAVRQH
jgi:exo-beta-1,3-glucanase (GH17 family)